MRVRTVKRGVPRPPRRARIHDTPDAGNSLPFLASPGGHFPTIGNQVARALVLPLTGWVFPDRVRLPRPEERCIVPHDGGDFGHTEASR